MIQTITTTMMNYAMITTNNWSIVHVKLGKSARLKSISKTKIV